MPETSTPMTLTAMQTFARRQLAHYTELVAVLDKIAVDPLSVVPQESRRGLGPAEIHKAAARLPRTRQRGYRLGPFVRTAMQKLSVGTAEDVLHAIKDAGWQSKTPDSSSHHSMVSRELKKLCVAKVLRQITRAGSRPMRYAMATPSKAAAKKLATAQAMVNGSGKAVEAVN